MKTELNALVATAVSSFDAFMRATESLPKLKAKAGDDLRIAYNAAGRDWAGYETVRIAWLAKRKGTQGAKDTAWSRAWALTEEARPAKQTTGAAKAADKRAAKAAAETAVLSKLGVGELNADTAAKVLGALNKPVLSLSKVERDLAAKAVAVASRAAEKQAKADTAAMVKAAIERITSAIKADPSLVDVCLTAIDDAIAERSKVA